MTFFRVSPGLLAVSAITVAIIAISTSAPLIAYAAAPALAIAFWRNALAVAVLAPVVGIRPADLSEAVRGRHRREGRFALLAGLALAVHFATWVPSVHLSSVATATALVSTQPVWQGLIARAQGRRLSAVGWLGIAVAVGGAALATGADLAVATTAVLGDVLALVGGVAAAFYTALGEHARVRLSTTTYTSICYGVCSVLLLVACLTADVRLGGYETGTWAAIVAITVGPQLLGHSLLNYALRRISATTISVLILLEVPGAALLAWVWLGQTVRAEAIPGLVLLMVGVAVVTLAGARDRRAVSVAPLPDAASPVAPADPAGPGGPRDR